MVTMKQYLADVDNTGRLDRINYLDGLRGIAILMVVFYHAYARWNELVPYGSDFSYNFLKHGYLGVQLFFIISGFVILMSLERCNSFKEFIFKRWIRLFPCMLICTGIIFFSASFFDSRPLGEPQLIGAVPGLLFIDPKWLEYFYIDKIPVLEGSFWSIYVEFKFYFLASLIYFFISPRFLIPGISLLFISSIYFEYLNEVSNIPVFSYLDFLCERFSLIHFGWFAAGSAFYRYKVTGNLMYFCFGLLLCLISSFQLKEQTYQEVIIAITISMLFAISLTSSNLQKLLSTKFLLILGFISYPLYLLHENMMISMIIQLDAIFIDSFPDVLLPIFPILLIAILAYIITKKIEKKARLIIVNLINYCNAKIKTLY